MQGASLSAKVSNASAVQVPVLVQNPYMVAIGMELSETRLRQVRQLTSWSAEWRGLGYCRGLNNYQYYFEGFLIIIVVYWCPTALF